MVAHVWKDNPSMILDGGEVLMFGLGAAKGAARVGASDSPNSLKRMNRVVFVSQVIRIG